jgi:16S rRNA A1518/A1519 N6-dimethyltransferase RsmA/KsgA/DIM1 with predicted DNA glycosylase/AP lyase activity
MNEITYVDFKRIIKESFKFKRKNLKNNLKDILNLMTLKILKSYLLTGQKIYQLKILLKSPNT